MSRCFRAYTLVLGRPPAEADLQRHFRVTPPSVHRMVLALERAGLIRRRPGIARGIQVWSIPKSRRPYVPASINPSYPPCGGTSPIVSF
jgi:hypothetical protein